ncbi:unnamed protein product [Calypogeia fissa]
MSTKSSMPISSRDRLRGKYGGRIIDQQVSVRVDPLIQHDDNDEMISQLHEKVHRLKNIAQEIESETQFQNKLLNQLESRMHTVQDKLSGTMKRLNRSIAQKGSKHMTHVMLFVFLCVAFIIVWTKLFRS